MTPEEWNKVSEIFHSAVALETEERAVFLDRVCNGDGKLRREVESLIAADTEAEGFIDQPAVNVPEIVQNGPASPAGTVIGHYRIEKSIGRGGMGEVYLATDTRLNRKVALKKLPDQYASDPAFLRRFQNEALAAATLNHPNVATIYSVEEFEAKPFITMEYVEGETVEALTPATGLDIRVFLDWFIPLSKAIQHAHDNGVTHRDIKPGNIMIDGNGVPKILDFGLAQLADQTHTITGAGKNLTEPGQVIGTPSYMSPEQAEGKEVDHRTDIFSFGVVMYEALTGQRPFTGDSHAEVVSNLLKSDPLPISALRPDIPAPFLKIVGRCLQKSKDERFQTMRQVTDSLVAIRSFIQTGRSFESFQRRLFFEARTPSVSWLPVAGLLVIIAAVGAWYYFSFGVSENAINFAELTFRKLSQSNNVVFAHVTADGKSMVYNTIEENEMRAMYIRRVDDRNSLQLLPPQPVQFWGGLTTSRDGSTVYYITAGRVGNHGTMFRISSLGGPPRKLVERVNDLGSLSPDGTRILFVRYGDRANAHLMSASSTDGTDERVIQTGGQNVLYRDPQYSVDGTSIYAIRFDVVDGTELWSVVQLPSEGGDEKVIIPTQRPKISELVVLRSGTGILMNATDPESNLPQLYHLSVSSGLQTRITNDLSSYFGISADEKGETIVAAQRYDDKAIWVGDTANWNEFKRMPVEPSPYAHVRLAPDGTIVFDGIDNNRPHIYSMTTSGQNIQQLTPNDSIDQQPCVTPDGRYIVFTSYRSGEPKVWRMNLDGSEPVLLTPGEGAAKAPKVSPDGGTVYFVSTRNNERFIASVPIDGGEVVKAPFQSEQYWAISPDGRQVVSSYFDNAAGRSQVKLAPLAGETAERILPITPTGIMMWSHDGSRLIFRSRDSGENPYATIWTMDPSSGEARELFDVKPDSIIDLSISADGKRAALIRGKLITDAIMMSRLKK